MRIIVVDFCFNCIFCTKFLQFEKRQWVDHDKSKYKHIVLMSNAFKMHSKCWTVSHILLSIFLFVFPGCSCGVVKVAVITCIIAPCNSRWPYANVYAYVNVCVCVCKASRQVNRGHYLLYLIWSHLMCLPVSGLRKHCFFFF